MSKKIILPALLACAIALIDRITKYAALTHIITPWKLNSFLQFKLVFNRGITWGLLQTPDRMLHRVLTVVIISLIWGLTLYTVKRYQKNKLIIGEVCVLAGALSNLYDRILYSGVIDFIELSYKKLSWPIFNIADIAIVLGVIIMSVQVIKES